MGVRLGGNGVGRGGVEALPYLITPFGHHLAGRRRVGRRVVTVAAELVTALLAVQGAGDAVGPEPEHGVAAHRFTVYGASNRDLAGDRAAPSHEQFALDADACELLFGDELKFDGWVGGWGG